MGTINPALFSSARDDWETPPGIFAALDAEFGFTLDPCCTPATAKCPTFYTPGDDGLSKPWRGTVYVNPPYGREIGRWMAKAKAAAKEGATVVCLVPARTDSRWWHEHSMAASEIRLLTRRLRFVGAPYGAPFPAALVVFRPGHSGPPTLLAQAA